jgi:hypothetical protein
MKCSSCEVLCGMILWGGAGYLASHLLGDATWWVLGIFGLVCYGAAKIIEARHLAHFKREWDRRKTAHDAWMANGCHGPDPQWGPPAN